MNQIPWSRLQGKLGCAGSEPRASGRRVLTVQPHVTELSLSEAPDTNSNFAPHISEPTQITLGTQRSRNAQVPKMGFCKMCGNIVTGPRCKCKSNLLLGHVEPCSSMFSKAVERYAVLQRIAINNIKLNSIDFVGREAQRRLL